MSILINNSLFSSGTVSGSADTDIDLVYDHTTSSGDVLLLIGAATNRQVLTPSGYILLASGDASIHTHLYIMGKQSNGGETSTIVNSDFAFNNMSVVGLRVSGVSLGDISIGGFLYGQNATAVCTGITTTVDNSKLLRVAGFYHTSTSITSPTGVEGNFIYMPSGNSKIGLAWENIPIAMAVGSRNWSNNFTPWTTTTISLAPSTVLSAPTDLLATTIDDIQINLSWSAATGGDTSGDGYSYQVQRSGVSATYSDIGDAQTGTTYQDTGLTPSTDYWYRVIVTDDAGASGISNEAHATTNPAALHAGIISFVNSGPGGISLRESTAPSGSITNYTRQWQRSDNNAAYTNLSLQTGITLFDSGVTNGVVYRYKTQYTDSVTTSGYSNIITAQVYNGGELSQSIQSVGGRRTRPNYIGF